MVWSQFSIKILGIHYGSSVLDKSNWHKISHSLAEKKINISKSTTHLGWDPGIWTLVYRSNIHYSKIYQSGYWKNNSWTLFGSVD